MNLVILIGVVFAGIMGWLDAGKKMERAKHDPTIGVRPSKNLFSFLFLD
jgi:hypothetical protein